MIPSKGQTVVLLVIIQTKLFKNKIYSYFSPYTNLHVFCYSISEICILLFIHNIEDCTEGCTSQINSNGEKICLCDTTSPVKCPSIKGCNKKCEFGYQKDENNCNVCECEECNKKCSRGFLTDQKGFSICKCKRKHI